MDTRKQFEEWFAQSGLTKYKDTAFMAWQAAIAHAVPRWIPVEERLPENQKEVLAHFRNSAGKSRIVRAIYVPEKAINTADWDYDGDDIVYDEEEDANFWPEGWYEFNEHEDTHWRVDDPVTDWMPLPAAPAQGEKE